MATAITYNLASQLGVDTSVRWTTNGRVDQLSLQLWTLVLIGRTAALRAITTCEPLVARAAALLLLLVGWVLGSVRQPTRKTAATRSRDRDSGTRKTRETCLRF